MEIEGGSAGCAGKAITLRAVVTAKGPLHVLPVSGDPYGCGAPFAPQWVLEPVLPAGYFGWTQNPPGTHWDPPADYDAVQGTWYDPKGGYLVELRDDGTYSTITGTTALTDRGTWTVDRSLTRLTLVSGADSPTCREGDLFVLDNLRAKDFGRLNIQGDLGRNDCDVAWKGVGWVGPGPVAVSPAREPAVFNGPVTDPSPWQAEQLDLDAYLSRIGRSGGPPSRAALDSLHEAHVRAFTFDNIDVLLDPHPGVALDAVQAKFVGRGRGGYCFEHGVLFAAALERLGYDVERRLGRVGDPEAPADALRGAGDRRRRAAAGRPRLRDERAAADPARRRRRGRLRRLALPASLGAGGPRPRLGAGALARRALGADAHPRRAAGASRSTSTSATTTPAPTRPIHFRNMLMVTKHLDGRHVAVTHETVTVRRPGEPTQHRALRDGELSDLLDELAVPLTADEREAAPGQGSSRSVVRCELASLKPLEGVDDLGDRPGPAHGVADDGGGRAADRVVAGPERDARVATGHGDLG